MKRVLFFASVLIWFSCEPRQGKQVEEAPTTTATSVHEIVPEEVLQVSSYTYVKGTENAKDIWLALPKREVEIGKTYYYTPEMEMKDFKSKDLDRTFESIYFLSGIYDSPNMTAKSDGIAPDDEFHTKKEPIQKQDMNVPHAEGEFAIEYIYKNKEALENKKVTVKGIVTKINPQIMDRNWVHIQDGTGGENTFDLTITTLDNIEVGSIASFEGVVAINKDFGHGYKYDLIIEEAVLLNQKPDVKVN